MAILITGAAGLVGSSFSHWIAENKPECVIVGVDDLSGGYLDNVSQDIVFFKENLLHHDLDSIFQKFDIDVIYHFAAYAAEGLSPFMRTFNYNNNLVTSARLISLAIKYSVKRFVFTSSMAVYGDGSPPFSETDYLRPVDPYGIAKYAVEMDLRVAYAQHGLEYCIIRPHNIYGPRQNIWDRYRNVLGIWMNQHLNDQPLTIYGDGKQQRAFSFISDCLEPLWNAGHSITARCETINLGGKTSTSIEEAANLLSDIMGGSSIIHNEARHEVRDAWCTWEKSETLLGYNELHKLQDGLKVMWEWSKSQPRRPQKIWESYELEKDIYSYWK